MDVVATVFWVVARVLRSNSYISVCLGNTITLEIWLR